MVNMVSDFFSYFLLQCNENITDCGGKTTVVLPADCPRSVEVIAGD